MKRRLREAREQAESEQRFRAAQLEADYQEYCQARIAMAIEADYPAERLEAALREQMKIIKREQPEWFARIPETTRREVALGRLKSLVRENLDLPGFEHWSKRNDPQQLPF
jgi:hypothetical protein